MKKKNNKQAVKLPKELLSKLESAANIRGLSVTELLEQLIREEAKKRGIKSDDQCTTTN